MVPLPFRPPDLFLPPLQCLLQTNGSPTPFLATKPVASPIKVATVATALMPTIMPMWRLLRRPTRPFSDPKWTVFVAAWVNLLRPGVDASPTDPFARLLSLRNNRARAKPSMLPG